MAYCQGCGAFVGDYSLYRHKMPGRGEMILCYRCKRWVDRHPGTSSLPRPDQFLPAEIKRFRTFSTIYIIGSFGVFAAGAILMIAGSRTVFGLIILLGAVSLFLVGWWMRKFTKGNNTKIIP